MKKLFEHVRHFLAQRVDHALSAYAALDWTTQQRARALLLVDLIVIIGALLDGGLSSIFMNQVTPSIISDAVLFSGLVMAVVYLVSGKYVAAVNITVLVSTIGITAARILSTGKFSHDVSYEVIQYALDLVIIVFLLVLLAKRTWQIVLASVMALVLLSSYCFSLTAVFHLPVSGSSLSVMLSGFIFLTLACFLALVTFLVNRKAIEIAERESAASKESEGKLRAMVDLSLHFVGLLTPDGITLEANQSALDFAGVRANDVTGKPFWDTPWWDHSPEMKSRIRSAIGEAARGHLVQFEATHRSAEGSLRIVDFSLKPVFVQAGKVAFLIPEGRDITERKEMEEALTESWARYQTLFDVADDAIFLLKEGVFVECNAKTLSMFGTQSEQILGQSPWRFSPAIQPDGRDSRGKAMEKINAALAGMTQAFEWKHCRYDGSVFDAEVSLTRMELAKGEVFVLAIVRDVTLRNLAENALRESEERYRALVENLPLGMVVSQEDIVVYANAGALQILKAKNDRDIIGRVVYDFIPEEYWERAKARRKNLIESATASGMAEFKFRRFDGTMVDAEALAVRIMYGGSPAVLNLISDITERKRAEAALHASMEQLHLLAARIERIREEERKLISHEVHDELGQVLTALKMDLSFLKQSGGKDRTLFEEKIQSMLSLSNSAIKTVQNISSKLRPGMLDDLGLIAAVEWQTEDFQKRSGVRCTLDLPKRELALDDARSTVLFRILQEALTNVARHANAHHVAVSLTLTNEDVTLSVVDDGVGITEEQRQSPKSIGLLGIRERLHPFHGNYTIRRGEHGGTEVRISIPKENPS